MTQPRPTGLTLARMLWRFYRDPLGMLSDAATRYGDMVWFKVGPMTMVQLIQPAHIQQVLQDHSTHYKMSGVFEETGRGGLPTIEGELWQKHRRLMQPAFQEQHLEFASAIIQELTTTRLESWRTTGKFERLNIARELLFLHHQILGKVLLGIAFETPEHPILQALATMRQHSARRVHALLPMPENIPTPRNRANQQARATLANLLMAQIASAPQPTILASLVEARDERSGDGFSPQEIVDELIATFFAAYEDPANVLTWVLVHLDQAPNLRETYSAPDRERVRPLLEEAMRLYPPTWSIMRDTKEEDTLDGIVIPRDTMVLLNVYLTQRLPAYWEAPTVFDPTRFEEKKALQPKFAYYPFGGGPRRCIGSAFAMLEMQIVLSTLLQTARWNMLPESMIRLEVHNSLQPAPTIWMRAEI